jgi:Rrf2 family protein
VADDAPRKAAVVRVTLSLRGDYAVRAMLALAEHERREPGEGDGADGVADVPLLSAGRIATRMNIPARFVAHVLSDLARAGLVAASAGRRGGYRLAVPPDQIDLLRIVDAAEPQGIVARCVLRGIPCDPTGRCAVHDAFGGATAALRAELARTSLAGLVTGLG